MNTIALLRRAQHETARSLSVFVRDVGHGLLEIGHNSLALLGLAVVAALVFTAGRADMRERIEAQVYEWLQVRHEARTLASGDVLSTVAEPDAVLRATAADPRVLARDQAALATWISRRYRVALEPVSALVQEAWTTGSRAKIDPTLILAIMAIESSFNPFAQSSVGAQGLMQVMTRVHDDKYEAFGGTRAAFDPISNLRVGVQVLKDCIARAGGLQEGLRYYVGAALLETDGGYAGRVLAEMELMRRVADGHSVSVRATNKPAPVLREAEAPAEAQPETVEVEQVALLR